MPYFYKLGLLGAHIHIVSIWGLYWSRKKFVSKTTYQKRIFAPTHRSIKCYLVYNKQTNKQTNKQRKNIFSNLLLWFVITKNIFSSILLWFWSIVLRWMVQNPTEKNFPDSNVHGANMGPNWVLSAPYGPHVGPMNLAIRVIIVGVMANLNQCWIRSMTSYGMTRPQCVISITVTSWQISVKSIVPQVITLTTKETVKILITGHVWGVSTNDRWALTKKVPWRRKGVQFMT